MAIPAGNGNCSSISICRRSPSATITPIRLTQKVQKASTAQVNCSPVSRVRAGIGATSPAETMEAAEEAEVWLMLFSSIPQSSVPKARRIIRQNPRLSSAAAMDILNDQPIFKPL